MENKKEINVKVGSGIIGTYSRMPQKLERVFAEFIDNATQSYFDNKDELLKIDPNYKNTIKITWSYDEIVIEDNSFGMNFEQFERAMRLNAPAEQYSDKSRSQFGMGLKIAAVYLGSFYSIESTQLGSEERYYSEVDVNEWKRINPETIPCNISNESKEKHFTRIIIRQLEKKLTDQIQNSLKNKLSLIYAKDLEETKIIFNGKPIVKEDPILHTDDDGHNYLETFYDSFEFNNTTYNFDGWIGILETASVDNAGFTLTQFGRGIKLNYRPDAIFGKSNSYPYQRIVGEINLDGEEWKISFNKDEFIWDNGLEKEFIRALSCNKVIKDMVNVAKIWRKRKDSSSTIKPTTSSYKKAKDDFTTDVNISNEKDNYSPDNKLEESKKEDIYNKTINFDGNIYNFTIKFEEKYIGSNWIDIGYKDDKYEILIDTNNNFFEKQNKDFIIKIAISLALAQITSINNGIKPNDSGIFLSQFNKIIKE